MLRREKLIEIPILEKELFMEIKKINIGLIGAGFMAKAHSIAYAGMPMFFWPAPAIPVKK